MAEYFQTMMSILTVLGMGGLIGGYVTYLLDKKKERAFKILEQKEMRYKSCLLYMDACFEPGNIKYLSSRHRDIETAQDILEYLKMEFHEMILYADKEVILAVKAFIENPVRENFLKTILVMRKSLSSGVRDLNLDEISLRFKS